MAFTYLLQLKVMYRLLFRYIILTQIIRKVNAKPARRSKKPLYRIIYMI